jgi:hypothetical protein
MAKEPTNVRRDEGVIFLEREVSRVEEVDLDVLEVGAVGLGALDGEDGVALAPHDERGRLMILEVGLPFGVPSARFVT